MQEISGKKLNQIKEAALCEAAAFVAAREAGIGLYFPYINLYHDGEQWCIDGCTLAQFKDDFSYEFALVDWAGHIAKSLLSITGDKKEYSDENPEWSKCSMSGETIEQAITAKEIVIKNKHEIVNIAKNLVSELFLKHQLVAVNKW